VNAEVERRLDEWFEASKVERHARWMLNFERPGHHNRRVAWERAGSACMDAADVLFDQIKLTRQLARINDETLADTPEVAAGRAYYEESVQDGVIPLHVKSWEEMPPWFRARVIRWATTEVTTCQSDSDGDCEWPGCPQLTIERARGCPLYDWNDPDARF
jgi:hypothetical protein